MRMRVYLPTTITRVKMDDYKYMERVRPLKIPKDERYRCYDDNDINVNNMIFPSEFEDEYE